MSIFWLTHNTHVWFCFQVGGAFQWPPSQKEDEAPPPSMPTLDNSQQAVQQTQQTYQQTVEKSTSYQQSTTTNSVQVQPAQNNNNVKPVSILKQTLPAMPTVALSENNLKPQPSAPETYSPGRYC